MDIILALLATVLASIIFLGFPFVCTAIVFYLTPKDNVTASLQ